MKKLLLAGGILFGVACLALVAVAIRRALERPGDPSHQRRIAAQINARAPIDATAMLEVTGASSDATSLTVRYQLLNARAANVEAPGERAAREELRKHSCETKELRALLDDGVTLHYVVTDIDNVPFLKTDVLRWECGAGLTAPSSQ